MDLHSPGHDGMVHLTNAQVELTMIGDILSGCVVSILSHPRGNDMLLKHKTVMEIGVC